MALPGNMREGLTYVHDAVQYILVRTSKYDSYEPLGYSEKYEMNWSHSNAFFLNTRDCNRKLFGPRMTFGIMFSIF
jgi:hypothetical protein